MKEALQANIRSLLLTVLILSSSAIQALAYSHPDEGRWLSRDPIEERGGVNLYNFCLNAPTIRFDPSGYSAWNPSRTPYGDGFDWLFESYVIGHPDWDANYSLGQGSGGTKSSPATIVMTVAPSKEKNCYYELKLKAATGEAWSWSYSWTPTAQIHEKGHANDYHNTSFVPTKHSAENVQGNYKTEKEATCWKNIVEKNVPLVNYYTALLQTLQGLDHISSGTGFDAIKTALAQAKATLDAEKAKCANP